jgi:hypothetical protein
MKKFIEGLDMVSKEILTVEKSKECPKNQAPYLV